MSPKARRDVPPFSLDCRELRQKAGLTQRQIAKELNVHEVAYARWEGGKREPRAENYKALSDLAKRLNLPDLADRFTLKTQGSKLDLDADKWRKDFYLRAKRKAEAGDETAKRLLELSLMDEISRLNRFSEALSDRAPNVKLLEITQENHSAEDLAWGRAVLAVDMFSKLQRQFRLVAPEVPQVGPSLDFGEVERRLEQHLSVVSLWKHIVAALKERDQQSCEDAIDMMARFESMLEAERQGSGGSDAEHRGSEKPHGATERELRQEGSGSEAEPGGEDGK
jgi:transcriptional regulator with XRE-family HTH domain